MKKLLYILLLYSSGVIYAQNTGNCPFQAKKYVHYDGRIESSSSYIPSNYAQLIQNNSAYARVNNHLSSSAKATCFYKTSIHNHDSIKKPFVFVEGISFEKPSANENEYSMGEYFKQGWEPSPPYYESSCYESFNSAPQYQGESVGHSTFNWATLVTGIDAEGYFDGDPLKVEKSPDLLNRLCCAGYDICFVDFHSGEAYIESNGEALHSILLKIHQQLLDNNSTEKIVVCGASMGGLVARYAINKLESEGRTDWVEKFISFDSPQMGANIPLSLQYTLKHLKGLSSGLEEKYNKLVCPSASQLVNYSCLETNLLNPSVSTIPVPSIERNELLNSPYMGWPQHCTKVAISNGSRMGLTQSALHQPGDKVLDIDGLVDLDLYALPENENSYKKVFDFDPPYCWLLSNPLTSTLSLTMQSVKVKNTMALDLAAGSYRKDLASISSQLPNFVTSFLAQVSNACTLDWTDNSINANQLCFIPLFSSIGAISYETFLKSNQAIIGATLLDRFENNYVFEDWNHEFSYFDKVYAPAANQGHVEITDENIGWVMEELTGLKVAIIHENINLPSETFKVSNMIIAGNNIVNSPACDQLPPPNSAAAYDLAYIHCGDVNVQSNKTVFYKAGEYISLEPGFNVEQNATFEASIINVPHCYSGGRSAPPSVIPQSNMDNNWDESELVNSKHNIPNKEEQTGNSFAQISVFPNPANEYVEIKSSTSIDHISICSIIGNTISTSNVQNTSHRCSTSELSNGVYLIKIKTNKETLIEKLVIKHQ